MSQVIDKAKLIQITENFLIDEFRAQIEEFIGFEAAEKAFEECANSPFRLVSLIEALSDYARSGDYTLVDPEVELGVFEAFMEFKLSELFRGLGDFSRDRKYFKSLIEALDARNKLDPLCEIHALEMPLTRSELAAVAGMSEESIRVSSYAQGDQKLHANEDGTIEIEEARRWLTAKKIRWTSKVIYTWNTEPEIRFSSVQELASFLGDRADQADLDVDLFLHNLESGPEEKKELRKYLAKGQTQPRLDASWITPETITTTAKALRLAPHWLVERLIDAIARTQKSLILKKIDSTTDHTAVAELNSNELATAENIRQFLDRISVVSIHALQKKANAKMDGYQVGASALAFTHEHSQRTQFIWCRKQDLIGQQLDSLLIKEYPASELDKGGNYGRHSGLKKYPELAYADLLKITIRTIADLESVMKGLGVKDVVL